MRYNDLTTPSLVSQWFGPVLAPPPHITKLPVSSKKKK